MPFVIDESLEIAAPPQLVWRVVTDLDAYPEWNPFVVACRSTLEIGAPIVMRVCLFGRFAQPQTETVFEHAPGSRLCYGLAADRLGGLHSRRCHELAPGVAGGSRYRSHFELDGWLAPLVRALLGRRLERGFSAMTRALGQRAEALAQAGPSPHA